MVTVDMWQRARAALETTGDRFAELLETVPDLERRATKDWSIVDTAVHVATIADLNRYTVAQDGSHPFPNLEEWLRTATVDDVATFNELAMRDYPHRTPATLAAQVRESVAALLSASTDPDVHVRWLGDSHVPASAIAAHLLNELLIHGRDIARAAGRTWHIPPEQAAIFVELFLVGAIRADYGAMLDHGARPPRRRVAVQFRSSYTNPVTFAIEDGQVHVAAPARNDDVRVAFDPPTLILMMFGRTHPLRAMLTRKVAVGGPRPWLLPAFLRVLHMPGRGDPAMRATLRT